MRVATALIVIVTSGSHLAAQRADTVVRRASAPVHAGVATLQREVSIGIADYMSSKEMLEFLRPASLGLRWRRWGAEPTSGSR